MSFSHTASSLNQEHTPLVPFLSHEDTPSYRFLAFDRFSGSALTHAASYEGIFLRMPFLPCMMRVFYAGSGLEGRAMWNARMTLDDAVKALTEVRP